jgi:hypothetical protein
MPVQILVKFCESPQYAILISCTYKHIVVYTAIDFVDSDIITCMRVHCLCVIGALYLHLHVHNIYSVMFYAGASTICVCPLAQHCVKFSVCVSLLLVERFDQCGSYHGVRAIAEICRG